MTNEGTISLMNFVEDEEQVTRDMMLTAESVREFIYQCIDRSKRKRNNRTNY